MKDRRRVESRLFLNGKVLEMHGSRPCGFVSFDLTGDTVWAEGALVGLEPTSNTTPTEKDY